MTEMAKGSVTHQRLIALLSQEGANFRVVTHEAVGKCEACLLYTSPSPRD